jgi:hypothetical protein
MIKNALLIGIALAVAGSAQAITTVSSKNGPDTGPLVGQSIIYDFESGTPAGLIGNFAIVQGSASGQYAAPLGDATHYLAVPIDGSSGSATLTLSSPLTSLSIYWGSIDTYNTISFADGNGFSLGSFTGAQIPAAPADGSQANMLNNRRVNFDFGGSSAASVTFTSGSKAFEVDDIAGTGVVPEPATWVMLIAGMGMVGAAIRRRRNSGVVVSA